MPRVAVGSPVRVHGVEVGRVVRRRGSRIDVVLVAPSRLAGEPSVVPALRRDATVRVRRRAFLDGAYYLELSPGSRAAPLLSDGAVIREGR